MPFSVDNDSFDFDSVGVSETAYYTFLADIEELDAVLDVAHSLPLNEIRLYVDATAAWTIGREFPDGITIQHAEYENHEEYGDCVRLTLTTTKYLCDEESLENYFGHGYSDEMMAFVQAQVNLFDEVERSYLVRTRDTGRLRLVVQPSDALTTTFVFNEVLTHLGGTFTTVALDEGSLKWLEIAFDGSSPFSPEVVDTVRRSKTRTYQRNDVYEASSVTAPCGHEVETNIMLFDEGIDPENAPKVTVDGVECVRLDIADTDAAILSPAEGTPTRDDDENRQLWGTALGYICVQCQTVYIACDETTMRERYSAPFTTKTVSIPVPDTGETYIFSVLDRPYYPLGELD